MPNPSNSPEAAAIEAAYQAHVELLFKSLVTNLGRPSRFPSERSAKSRKV